MIVHRGFRYRLRPTADQEARFRQVAGVVRLVYNLALEQRRTWWRHYRRETGRALNGDTQCLELTKLRAVYDWVAAVSLTCQQQALRDLDGAFAKFFKGLTSFPTPRKKGVHDAFRFQGRECRICRLNRSWGAVTIPKIGAVRFRWTRGIQGKIKNVTVSRDDLGWHVSFACAVEIDDIPIPVTPGAAIGIDRGVTHTFAFSDSAFGENGFSDLPMERLRLLERRARKHGRALARCKRGSRRRDIAKRRLARTMATAARIRHHWLHCQTTALARHYSLIVIEDLKVRNMTASAAGTIKEPGRNVRQKAGLNRVILEQGWRQGETLFAYKLQARGGELIKVNAAYTSQACSRCGSISKSHRKSQAVFECSDCGVSINADTNAAINILKAGTGPAARAPVAAPLNRESRKEPQVLSGKIPGIYASGRC